MDINKTKFIHNLNLTFRDDSASSSHSWTSADDGIIDMDKILGLLAKRIIDPKYTEQIGRRFEDILPLILMENVNFESKQDTDSFLIHHRRKCVALAKLVSLSSSHAQRFAFTYFARMPSPFSGDLNAASRKKVAKTNHSTNDNEPTKLDILKCSYTFLKLNITFFMRQWKWSEFIEKYGATVTKQSDEYKLIYNRILALLTGMTHAQLALLNGDIPVDVEINFSSQHMGETSILGDEEEHFDDAECFKWNLKNELFTNVEGVLLPIFNPLTSSNNSSIVMVDSAHQNLRSIAIGVAAGKAVCLSGSVGSGKTTLIEYLAYKTGRIPIRQLENVDSESKENNSIAIKDKTKSNKRKATEMDKTNNKLVVGPKQMMPNGFLRIQLGDQTDSKMLLGQYHCTDVPGEFVWQPGVLTQAVMNGYWLLLEDLDHCSRDVSVMLTNFFENNYLSVPGFRDCIQISSGFQLFVTQRSNEKGSQASRNSNSSYFQLLEKYLYTVNMLPLSQSELCEIVCEKYPKLSTVADRIVDVFLMISSSEAKEFMGLGEKSSGRLVSTRDLLKLCSRSSPTFSITSTECAYFVFQNAVDLFCSHLTQGEGKNNLVVNIGSRLGIIPSRCEYLSNEYKPDVSIDDGSRSFRVGRITLSRRGDTNGQLKRTSNTSNDHEVGNDANAQKRLRIDSESNFNIYQNRQSKQKTPNFSFTRLSSCLLERIAVAVQETEPVLLVGETGVGKTSSVQYLAHQTNHKLVVINMNNQSDVSDLIGGFKPVDLAYVIAPLRGEFEFLFKETFDASKNEKFLNNISVCYNQENFSVLIQLMLRIVSTVFTRKTKNAQNLSRWTALKIKLSKLNIQLEQSMNISFAFISGPLVNCIKNGDWVLLDEINLATPETLECLSTILEPNGSIVLLEKGDFVPVKRHPDFRTFACMNPSTDIGKKDLSIGIRNRFTEFFVDELTLESDLIILVSDYLRHTGIQGAKVLAIVQLYRKLRAMAQLELNDGLGNRPVYSLRTLCRALIICSKNLCGSIERNLYESFCLSFLTQLDPSSHLVVLTLIQKSLLPVNQKAVLSQGLPKPKDNIEYLNFEGYWIKVGQKTVQSCDHYIMTESVRDNLRDLARIISIGQLPVLLQGPTSAGKTSLIDYVARRSGNYCLRINNHEHTDLQEYIGTYTADVTGKLVFKEGVLVQAMKNGYWIILDELNLAPSDILEALNRVLDDNRELFIPETQELIRAHPNFMLFATQNPPGLYGGRKMLSRAFKNRFVELHFSDIPKHELEIILEKRCLIPKSYAQKMVKTMSELQAYRTNSAKSSFTLRDLFRWGNRYTFANKDLLTDNRYDWNQHLIDEGYLVLSSRVRNESDIDVIESALFTNFRKKIIVDNLFKLHDNTSQVTRPLLESITNYECEVASNVIWTSNMIRTAIMAGKSIEFNEPVLLVGQTGCGKTTICQILANIAQKSLRILNCHMHTEGADFLGGLRPFRGGDENDMEVESDDNSKQRKLFQWKDGPLIQCMTEGTFFLADEISLAEDSVLERLNCVLEPERTILLAEKGGGSNDNFLLDLANPNDSAGEFVIKANDGFQFLATMNPSGDFGKKELSPALRNRFTEIWCRSADNEHDLVLIAEHSLKIGFNTNIDANIISNAAVVIVKTVRFIKENVEKFHYSVRDILAWVQFITINTNNLPICHAIIFGLETMFLDSLEMLPHVDTNEIKTQRKMILEFLVDEIQARLKETFDLENLAVLKGTTVVEKPDQFGINPFFIEVNTDGVTQKPRDFKFTAPTTQKNLFRLLSAMSLHKAILLEGPPGVGKTSLIENVSSAIGYQMVRINLCEHTDLTDLFGTDQPSDEGSLALTNGENEQKPAVLGSFIWRDGPLLAALKAPNTWILLDELNLAPQSVLEGLNAILDHRGEVYVPELNKTFKLDKQTRIFASQNPLRQGGGRKGLPQSFLNRFTKVYLRSLDSNDLCHIIYAKYSKYFEQLKNFLLPDSEGSSPISYFESAESATIFDCCERMVSFSEKLEEAISNLEFGYKGGPYEVNLRDILRWCELLSSTKSGFIVRETNEQSTIAERYNNFMLILYEKMQLVYCHRMRSDTDKQYIRNVFGQVFCCDAEALEKLSCDISFYWNDEFVHFNDVRISRKGQDTSITTVAKTAPLMLNSQRQLVKALGESVLMETPVILCGPNDSGKTKLVDILCTLSNHYCNIDTIDDSVTGSFQQVDLNRHLEEIALKIEAILVRYQQSCLLNQNKVNAQSHFIKLLRQWETFVGSNYNYKNEKQTDTFISEELILFNKRIGDLGALIHSLLDVSVDLETVTELQSVQIKLNFLGSIVRNRGTLNTGGHFEWVDSKIVRALKIGQYICLEHVNLCSSAILDRLNSVFETDGKLLLSEKGVESNNQSESVSKHSDFRVFLTLDPRNGEISRAMRNRCIELSLMGDTYTRDDLTELIYMNGIHEMYLIEWALNIHRRVQKVSEFHSFNVSHLTKFAFLINENLRLGLNEATALFDSALVVYVRSSHIDLLGMGLSYYHEKLTEEIRDEISKVPDKCSNLVQLSNVIISANDLNSLTLIRLQCEPLIITIHCLTAEIEKKRVQKVFNAARGKFSNLSIDLDWKSAEYLLQMVHELSSLDDLTAREHYVNSKLQQKLLEANACYHDQLKNLIDLNHILAQTIRETSFNKDANSKRLNSVPWNQHIFPRLRDYFDESPLLLTKTDQLKLSAVLLANLLFDKIEGDTTKVKQSQINAITYSKAVNSGTIPNGLNIDLITYLYPLLDSIKTFTIQIIRKSNTMTYQEYSALICAYLWANRLYEESRNRLFKQKTVDQTLIDKLALHFNWLVKHLINQLNNLKSTAQSKELTQFRKTLQKILDCNTIRRHPLNELRKRFTKRLTKFMPFYEENQIVLHKYETEFRKQMQLPVKKWQSFEPTEYLQSLINKYRIILSDESTSFKHYLVDNADAEQLQWLAENNGTLTSLDDVEILTKLEQLSKSTAQFWGLGASISVEDLTEQNDKFGKYLELNGGIPNQTSLAPLKLLVSTLPIMEYFALRAFNSILRRNAQVHRPNMDFYKCIRSLDVDVLNSVRTVTTKQYGVVETMWDWILQKINNKGVETVFEVMPQSIYRKISSFVKMLDSRIIGFGYSSLALNHQYLLTADVSPKQQPTMPINSCALTISAFLSLFNEFGKSKSIGLGNLEVWSSTLTSLSKLLWNNVETFQNRFQFEHTNFEYSQRYGRKILAEIKYIQVLTESNVGDKSQVESEFLEVVQLLENKIQSVQALDDSSQARFQHFYTSAVIQSLAVVLELHLMTFTPLVDPVEKNRLKKTYTQENQQHVTGLTSAYDFMKVIMSYDDLGEQIIKESFCVKSKEFKVLLEKYSEKCALRPEVCVYAELVDQINFFLENGCKPKSQLQLISDIDAAFERLDSGNAITQQDLQNVDEIIKRIDWCINTAESFERSTIDRFSTYYRDFTAPLESSVIMLKNAFRCLKQCLINLRELKFLNLKTGANLIGSNENELLSGVLINLIEFPSVERRSHLMPATVRILETLENKDFAHSLLLKSVLQETLCLLSISGSMSDSAFQQFDLTIGSFNQIWKQQEEIKRAKSIEEDSLYVKKTRCADEDEEEITEQEIATMFPNYATADFGEFIQIPTLESDKKKAPAKPKPVQDLLTDDDLKFVGDVFLDIMFKYSRCDYYKPSAIEFNSGYYQVELLNAFESKSNVFYQLIQKYKHSLSSTVDDASYGGIALLINTTKNRYHTQTQTSSKPYNFYKDQNIPEVYNTGELLDRIEARVLNELKQWPDHAVLNDIIMIISRIRSLDITEPIARFNTGFQILRQKVDEWNSVSHKLNHLRDLEIEIAENVQRWMKLELQCWRECLATTADRVRSKAYRYWFFMYNLLHEYLECSITSFSCDLTDFKAVEKYFGEGEIDAYAASAQQSAPKLRTADVISVIKQFIESSNYGEFELRMKILKSFELYLQQNNTKGSNKKRERITSVIHNLHTYYSQFANQITETVKSKRTQIEKKLKEFVKIESYNKDLSYFGMKNNVARVHRHLYKFLREFETELMEKVAQVFVWKANETYPLNDEPNAKGSTSAYEPNITSYTVDVKHFVSSQIPTGETTSTDVSVPVNSESLLAKIDKLFGVSRNVVKNAILHAEFPSLLYNLDVELASQIETCSYLRGLEVDRSQEKPKQKSQAKHILTQKRKAVADCFKMLATLGLSFRSGLLELSMQTELVDLKLAPFNIQNVIDASTKQVKINQSLVQLTKNIDLNYSKCVFKLKLLQTVLLSPNQELGRSNMERIKGFTTDMFLLVQLQRQTLCKSTTELQQLQKNIKKINELHVVLSNDENDFRFETMSKKLDLIEQALIRISEVTEQYEILLNCVPNEEDKLFTAIDSSDVAAFTKSSEKYRHMKSTLVSVSQSSKKLLATVQATKDGYFHNSNAMITILNSFNRITDALKSMSEQLKLGQNNEYLVFAKPLVDLLQSLNINCESNDMIVDASDENHSHQNIITELENIVHLVLLSMQNIYKKYSTPQKSSDETPANDEDKVDDGDDNDDEEEEIIQKNHLKQKITGEINADWQTLAIASVSNKLTKICTEIYHSNNEEQAGRLECIKKSVSIQPILEQFELLCKYYLIQQLAAHRVSTKMLSVMLIVFIELTAKGFCIPPDLMQDEDGQQSENGDGKEGEGFGLDDGTGEKDVSDKIESEDQLDTAKKPGDRDDNTKEDEDCKETDGIDMSEDFDSKLQDIEKRGDDSSDEEESDNEELDKEMGDIEQGADKLDDQIWGSDEEKDENEEEEDDEMNEEADAKGSKEDKENHNNLDSEHNDQGEGEDQDGLDATNENQQEKQQKKDQIDKMNEDETCEDQANPYHNELEEPPEPEDMDLGDVNLDNQDNNDQNDEQNEENPFDIDSMKDNMQPEEDDGEEEGDGETDDKKDMQQDDLSDNSDIEDGDDLKKDQERNQQEEVPEEGDEENDNKNPDTQEPGNDIENMEEEQEPEKEGEEPSEQNKKENFHESIDMPSTEDNVQAMPDTKDQGTTDQVETETNEKNVQEDNVDAQDTGEEQSGIGQAANEESKNGHQGLADNKNTQNTEKSEKKEQKDRRKPGATDDDRTISENKSSEKKQLKTVQEVDQGAQNEEDASKNDLDDPTSEYQHIKDAKETENTITTMDNATEEQSKKVKHDKEKDDTTTPDLETNDELMEQETKDEPLENVPEQDSEKFNESNKNTRKGVNNDRQNEVCETKEECDVEGDVVSTHTVSRPGDTTAHCSVEIIRDSTSAQELDNAELLDIRKMYEKERTSSKLSKPVRENFEQWQTISNKMLPNARELCEQLRLILEPTKCTRLKGDYRTGRRINMKKIIPYIASQFRKDKIWLRRTKPAQRDYHITIAIDDSKSMDYNNSKELTLQAISLVSQALTLLESGRLSIMSFGESPKIILNHTDQFDGPQLVNSLNFAQNQSRIAELMEFIRVANSEDSSSSSDNGIFENLLLVLSDGRNIFSEGEKKVRNAIKLARLNRIFIVYIIIDNPDNKHSILDIRVPQFSGDRKTITMKSYLDTFPFPYYVIVRDLTQLPLVLSDAMRQWFELVSSEQ